jgi:large subunit ribosomal protein L19
MTKLTDIYPDVQVGNTVRVHEKIREINIKGQEKERVQIFEGVVIARKHGSQPGATITVRKIAKGNFGVEKIYPLHSPIVDKIEVTKKAKVRRSKLYFIRTQKYKLKEIKA